MTQHSMMFGAVAGDRSYGTTDFARQSAGFLRDGILYHVGEKLDCGPTTPETMAVRVAPGEAAIQGYRYWSDAYEVLAVAAADPVNTRIDTVVLRCDPITARAVSLNVVTGFAEAVPTAPALVRDGAVYDVLVATVTVPPGATAIASYMIDQTCRADPARCGWAVPHRVTSDVLAVTGPIDMAGQHLVGLPSPAGADEPVTRAYLDAAIAALSLAVPTGTIACWAGPPDAPPAGWLTCDGSQFLRSTYPALAALLDLAGGTAEPPGGPLYCCTPDFRAASPVGYDRRSTETATANAAVGALSFVSTAAGAPNNLPGGRVTSLIVRT